MAGEQRTLQLFGFAADPRLRKKLWRGKQPPLQFDAVKRWWLSCRYRYRSRFESARVLRSMLIGLGNENCRRAAGVRF